MHLTGHVNMVDPVRKKRLEIVMEELVSPFYAFKEFSIILTIMSAKKKGLQRTSQTEVGGNESN